MAISKALYSSASDEWRTPDSLFNYLDNIYDFTLDAAATDQNSKCPDYFTAQNSALTNNWRGRVWCNPPYSKGLCSEFVSRAYTQVCRERNAELAVLLLPARTDTKMWHELIFPLAEEVIFLKGRLKFMDGAGLTSNSAPFPSALVVYKPDGPFLPTKVGTLEASPVALTTPIKYLN